MAAVLSGDAGVAFGVGTLGLLLPFSFFAGDIGGEKIFEMTPFANEKNERVRGDYKAAFQAATMMSALLPLATTAGALAAHASTEITLAAGFAAVVTPAVLCRLTYLGRASVSRLFSRQPS